MDNKLKHWLTLESMNLIYIKINGYALVIQWFLNDWSDFDKNLQEY